MRSKTGKLVQHGALVYVQALAQDTPAALAAVDRLLAQAGVDKAKLLTARVQLPETESIEAHEAAWREWIDPAYPPVVARSLRPRPAAGQVELEITATR